MRPITLPPFPLTGGCQCGAVRFKLNKPPVVFYLCHCTDCQKQSSSAYGESVKVNAADVEVEGEIALLTATADSGATKYLEFCPKCGVRLFHGRKPGAAMFNMKGGTFDDVSWLRPAGHIWANSKQPFVTIGDDEISYPRQQPDLGPLVARWRAMTES